MANTLFCLMGPTASGKTALACELVKIFPFELISVDSAMIYREMNIGTAKPSKEELHQAPHHLIDILDPSESYSAARFCEDVIALSEAIVARGNIPLLVGGTMMYFNALQQGLSSLPAADETLRRQLLQQADSLGWAVLHQQLQEVDPSSAARIHPNDSQRLSRALEVYQLTGRPLSAWLNEKTSCDYQFVNLILVPKQRAWLHERIAHRFGQMLEQGFLAEVEQLIAKWSLTPTCPAMRSVGYRQAWQYLAGDYDYATLCFKGIAATRQLAKRQLTWLRHWPQASYFTCENSVTQGEIIALIREILDNKPQMTQYSKESNV